MSRVDYEQMASTYDAGRDHPSDRRGNWRHALAPYVDPGRPLLDLGSGTGQWSGPLSDWFDLDVVAVEPSANMRVHAHSRQHARVSVTGGAAECLPVKDHSIGTAWISAVWHHLADPVRASEELCRVTAPGGYLCIRGAFPDAGTALDLPTIRAFPEAATVLDTFPSILDVRRDLERAGLEYVQIESVTEFGAENAIEVYERATARADTLLRLLPDDVYERRLSHLADAIGTEQPLAQQVARLPLLVFRTP